MSTHEPSVRNFFWPRVDTIEGANAAVRQAAIAAAVIAGLTLLISMLAIAGVKFIQRLGVDAWSTLDAAAFGVIAFFLARRSRVAAWAGLLLYVAERLFQWLTVGPRGPIMAVIFTLAFIGGVRGCHAVHRFRRAAVEDERQLAA